jgi:hypothetical protein
MQNFTRTSLWMYYASLMVQVHPILHQTESPIPLFPQSVLVLSFLLIFLLGEVSLFVSPRIQQTVASNSYSNTSNVTTVKEAHSNFDHYIIPLDFVKKKKPQ